LKTLYLQPRCLASFGIFHLQQDVTIQRCNDSTPHFNLIFHHQTRVFTEIIAFYHFAFFSPATAFQNRRRCLSGVAATPAAAVAIIAGRFGPPSTRAIQRCHSTVQRLILFLVRTFIGPFLSRNILHSSRIREKNSSRPLHFSLSPSGGPQPNSDPAFGLVSRRFCPNLYIMKTTLRNLMVLGAFTSALLTVHAEKVQLEQLPQALRDQIRAHTGGAQVEDIDRQTKSGQTLYEIAFKRDGRHTELLLNDQGQLVNADGTLVITSGKVNFRQLPPAVQNTVRFRTRAARINDIDRQVKDGQITYEVGFTQNGQQQELLVSQDGRILRDVTPRQAAGAPAAGIIGRGAATAPGMLSPTQVQVANSQKVSFDQAPAEVRNAITARTGGARIEDFEMGTWNGRPVYTAAFKSGNQHIELQVAADGSIVFDPRGPTPGAPVDRASATTVRQLSNTAVQLSAGEKVDRRSVPAAVERAIQRHATGKNIEDVEKGGWQGRTVYQVAFKENGQHVELQIDETGQLVHDPRLLK
jgi:uncharacterized membrane protein YkoI